MRGWSPPPRHDVRDDVGAILRPGESNDTTLALLCVIVATHPAAAKEPPLAVQVAREFLTPEFWSRYVDASVAEYAAKYRATVEKHGGTADAGLEPALRDFYVKALPYKELLDLEASVLQKHFTESELQELLRFYRTPVGRKMLEKMPEVHRDALALAMQKFSLEELGAAMRPHFHGPAVPTKPDAKTGTSGEGDED